MYKITTLKNGLRIITHKIKSVESAATGVWICVGGRFENIAKSGISHFMEHMLFKGTKNRSATKLKEDVEGIGGLFNGFTDDEATCFMTKIVSEHLDESLDVLSDMVQDPLLLDEDVEKERSIILEEIKMYEDIPMQYIHELIASLLWPDQPLGMPISGTAETVKGIKKEDLLGFKSSFYTGKNIVVVCCGNVDHEKFVKSVGSKFKKLGLGKTSEFAKAVINQKKPQLKIQNKDTQQTHISLGLHSYSKDHPDRYALGLLNIILGANMSSRLFKEFREKRGLVYEISSHVRHLQDTGAFLISAGLDHNKLVIAVELILKELKKIKNEPVERFELMRAKEYFSGQLKLTLEDTLDYMIWLGQKVVSDDKLYSPKEIIEKINKVKVEDIRRVANDIFINSSLNFALIGPATDKDRQKLEQLLDIER